MSSKRPATLVHKTVSTDDDSQVTSPEQPVIDYNKTINVETVYDNNNRLEKITFFKNKGIPRKVFKVIALAIPYQEYLTSIAINGGLRKDTLHEISKFLPNSNITELCLDGAFLPEANYHKLLTDSRLKHLSLAKCSINDVVVKTITDLLVIPHPASNVLSALNLSSNKITDVGAKYVAGMLRSNRQLSYLNLAGNMITDEGGMSILDTLQKFPLEAQELSDCRARYVAYLTKKAEYMRIMAKEFQRPEENKTTRIKKNAKTGRQSVVLKMGDARKIKEKVRRLTEDHIGLFNDHFSSDNIESKDGVVRCFGNNTLCWLNLAYNQLTYLSVKKLLEVLVMQKYLNRTPHGLIKVVIEGNPIPEACEEYGEINCLLELRLVGIRVSDSIKKKQNRMLRPQSMSSLR